MADEFPPEELEQLRSITADDNLGRPIRVFWIDSGLALPHHWMTHEESAEKAQELLGPVETVGLWMGENEKVVMVGQSRDHEHGNWMASQVIWKIAITGMDWL